MYEKYTKLPYTDSDHRSMKASISHSDSQQLSQAEDFPICSATEFCAAAKAGEELATAQSVDRYGNVLCSSTARKARRATFGGTPRHWRGGG